MATPKVARRGLPHTRQRNSSVLMETRPTAAVWLAQQYLPDFSPEPVAPIRLREFRPFGYELARKLGGKFDEDPRPGICKNHDIALLVLPKRTIRILMHHEFQLLALAQYREANEGYGGYEFVDVPEVKAALGEGFYIAPKNVLEKPFDYVTLRKTIGKVQDIDYWNPKRIGDVFFNFWD